MEPEKQADRPHLKIVVKRAGVEEPYDHRKIYASVYAAAIASGALRNKSQAEDLAAEIAFDVDVFVSKKDQPTSDEIFDYVTELVTLRDKKIAAYYEAHRKLE